MPFNPGTEKEPGNLVLSKDWNDAMHAIVSLFSKLDPNAGHKHDGSAENGPKIEMGGIANKAIGTDQIEDGAVTLAKIKPGDVSRKIGIAISSGLFNAQNISAPSGFTNAECHFFVFVNYIAYSSLIVGYEISVNEDGLITANYWDAQGQIVKDFEMKKVGNFWIPYIYAKVTGVAIGMKNGWS